jgi:NADH dehydrogenase
LSSGPDFDRPGLVESLHGAAVLYNTYWSASTTTFRHAAAKTPFPLEAARLAGVRRVVHVSITTPEASPLEYFKGKARLRRRCGTPA